jgi:16S rRNA (uracil1498-N3)-methyltransferase
MDQSSRLKGRCGMKAAPWLLAQPGELVTGQTLELDPVEGRHAGGALRLKEGREVVLTDGSGNVASGVLSSLRRGSVEVAVESVAQVPASNSGLSLAMGVLAGAGMDLVVQKAVELGVESFVPVCCDRSQFGLSRATARANHWTRLARQALKQCHRAWAMDVAPAASLVDLLAGVGPDRGVVAHSAGVGIGSLDVTPDCVLLVGPEGGFTVEEDTIIDKARWCRLCLGPHVLRAETAAIAGSAVVLARMGAESGLHS